MKKNLIALNIDFNIGDVVEPVINSLIDEDERMYYVITGFVVFDTDEAGQVTSYSIQCQDDKSNLYNFSPATLRVKENV